MELKVFNKEGKQSDKSLTLNSEVFEITPNESAIYLDVKNILANSRQGTSKTKERSEISGSTRKLFRQKGTGRARRGDIKSPILRGGGRVFGPRPRDYSFKLNKKVKKLARQSAIVQKIQNEEVIVVDNITLEQPKTKEFVKFLKNFQLTDKKVLLVMHEVNKHIVLASRNLQNVKVLLSSQLNTYDILWAQKLIITQEALNQIEQSFLN